jgi:hypothetical protein
MIVRRVLLSRLPGNNDVCGHHAALGQALRTEEKISTIHVSCSPIVGWLRVSSHPLQWLHWLSARCRRRRITVRDHITYPPLAAFQPLREHPQLGRILYTKTSRRPSDLACGCTL